MKVLAALDFSSLAKPVMETAERLASTEPGELWLLHVADPEPDFVGYEPGPQEERDHIAETYREQHRMIQESAEEIRNRGTKTTALLVQGATAETILEEAEKLGVDLIVIGSHGHGPVYQVVVGSVSEAVLRKTSCPVVMIPAERE